MDSNVEIIYGRNPVKEALRAGRVKEIYVSDTFNDQSLLNEIKSSNVKLVKKSNNELTHLVDGVHQGIIAFIKRYEYASLEDILRIAKSKNNPLIIMLDEINDPHNLGAIMRSADIFGACGIIVKKHHQALLNSTVAKTSAGAINFVKVAQVGNLTQTIKQLNEKGFWIVSADGSGSTNYFDLDYNFPCVLVIGNEGDGISRLVLENSDYIVKIPMHGKINSLNASVAAAVLMSYIVK